MRRTQPQPERAAARRRRSRFASRSPRAGRGAVIVVALLGAFLIAGLLGYVFNTGRHAQLRQQTQHAADATAISGAGYVARTFNTVAMNNVEMSRLIPAIQLLDAVPMSVDFTLQDVQATLERVEEQLRSGTGDALGDSTLEEIRDKLERQEELLLEMNEVFNEGSYDVSEMTFYDSEAGRGEMWKAMESMDAVSTAAMEHLTDLAQVTAHDSGTKNMGGGSGEKVSVIAPFEDGFVWDSYRFDEFEVPVLRGQLPDYVDDEITNRGPYDTIFGWRRGHYEGGYWVRTGDGAPRTTTTRPGSRWSGGTGGGRGDGYWVSGELVGYSTRGTWWWLSRKISNLINEPDVLENSQFTTRVVRMAGNKLNNIWPGSFRNWVFLDPEWITDYDEAESVIAAGTPRVAYTQFIRMEYEQNFLNGRPLGPEYMYDWDIIRPGGGWTRVPGARMVRDYVWEDQAAAEWEVTYELPSGITRTDVYETRYRWLFVWAGINVGPEITIPNPNNYASKDDLAGPIDFVHEAMERPEDGAVGRPGSPFTFLGLSKQPNEAPMWSQLFDTSAYDGHTAIAQASVWNNHSWDLWTQMWHAQLEPVQDYDQWVDLMRDQVGSLSDIEDVNAGEVEEMLDYLEAIKPLAPVMLNH